MNETSKVKETIIYFQFGMFLMKKHLRYEVVALSGNQIWNMRHSFPRQLLPLDAHLFPDKVTTLLTVKPLAAPGW